MNWWAHDTFQSCWHMCIFMFVVFCFCLLCSSTSRWNGKKTNMPWCHMSWCILLWCWCWCWWLPLAASCMCFIPDGLFCHFVMCMCLLKMVMQCHVMCQWCFCDTMWHISILSVVPRFRINLSPGHNCLRMINVPILGIVRNRKDIEIIHDLSMGVRDIHVWSYRYVHSKI